MKKCFVLLIFLCVTSCQQPSSKSQFKPNSLEWQTWDIANSVRALEVIDENMVWYAGSGGKYGYTEDGGKTWQRDSIQLNGKTPAFRAIAATQEAVFLLSIASPTYLLKTEDKGKNWKIVYQENDSLSFYNSMAFWDDQYGIATGDPIGGCLSVILTKDGGNNWEKLPCDALPAAHEGEAEFAASNTNIALAGTHAWIVTGGKKARVFHSPDRGETWEVVETPIVQGEQMTGIYSVDFRDEQNGVIFGGDWNDKTRNTQNKAITQDGGKTWQLAADGQHPGYRSCVQYLNENELIAVGSTGISYSSDGGNNWQPVSEEGFYTARFSPSGKVLWLAGSKRLGKITY